MAITKNSHNKPKPPGGAPQGGAARMELKKSKGQHLLKNPGILDKITNAAQIKSSDVALEIGPGTGNLTMRMLPLARQVVALDIDARMSAEVKKRASVAGYANLSVRNGDALKSDLGVFDVCVANLPYQISSPFVFRLLAHRPRFRCAVLMFQREFAERLVARAGEKEYCRLSVNAQLFSDISRVCKVSAGSFNPPPKVESMVVKIVPKDCVIPVDFREWDGMLRVCFGRKNRTIRASFNAASVLKGLEERYAKNENEPSMDFKSLVLDTIEELGLTATRALTITTDGYLKMLLAFHKKNIRFSNFSTGEWMDDVAMDES